MKKEDPGMKELENFSNKIDLNAFPASNIHLLCLIFTIAIEDKRRIF